MKRKTLIVMLLVTLMTGVQVGCASHSLNVDHSPETLGKIGAQINQNPDRTTSILTEHNLTKQEFRTAVRQISEDPELSDRYHDGFQSAQSDS